MSTAAASSSSDMDMGCPFVLPLTPRHPPRFTPPFNPCSPPTLEPWELQIRRMPSLLPIKSANKYVCFIVEDFIATLVVPMSFIPPNKSPLSISFAVLTFWYCCALAYLNGMCDICMNVRGNRKRGEVTGEQDLGTHRYGNRMSWGCWNQ